MIAVDFDVYEGKLRNVVVTGDFFLYPEEALPVLTQALEGAPVASRSHEIADRVTFALANDITLVGASPEGVAIAIERALLADGAERDSAG